MKEYLGRWQFWVAVMAVTIIVHFVWSRFAPKMGG